MYREPLFLTILRLVGMVAMMFVLFMIWWSMGEQESSIKEINEVLKKFSLESLITNGIPTGNKSLLRPHLDQKAVGDVNLPNLLKPDPYYEVTLPNQLGKDFVPNYTLQGAVLGKPDNLHPFSNWAQVSSWNELCVVSAARSKFGIYETLSPYMGLKIEEKPGGQEFWVYLRKGVFWQPLEKKWFPEGFKLAESFLSKQPVTANDYKFYFDALMNPAVSESGAVARRTYLQDVESLEVVDDYTFIVKWKKPKYVARLLTGSLRPLPSFVYKYFPDGKKIIEEDSAPDTYRKNAVWAFNFSNHWAKNIIVSCGPWIFDGMSDRNISFKRNPDHFFPLDALSAKQEIALRSSADTIWQDFKEEKLDVYSIPPEQLLELKQFLDSSVYKNQSSRIKRLDYPAQSYAYIGWNEKKQLFKSKEVRRALTMAIDRSRIIRQTLNGQGEMIHGTFLKSSPANNAKIKPWSFDPRTAKRILEEQGWFDRDGSGVVSKVEDGETLSFRFTLTYYVKNLTSKAVADYVAGALKNMGIKVDLKGVDIADISKVFEDKDFDALLMGWGLGTPPEDPRQLWASSEADKKGSSNAVGFKNKEADTIIDQLDFEKDPEKRVVLYHRFDEILHEEQPYTFLYSPKATLLYRDWMKNVFIPEKRQDLIPGANVPIPELGVAWIER